MMSDHAPEKPQFQIGDRVKITGSRFALPASPYSLMYSQLWKEYGNREGVVIEYANFSAQQCDDPSCVIQFADGDTVSWANHHLTKLESL